MSTKPKLSPRTSNRARSAAFPKFTDVEKSVFEVVKTGPNAGLYVGGDRLTDALRSVLRDEAINMQNSRLWEVLNASVVNEAYNLSLLGSQNWDHVQFAKAMKHWSTFMVNVIHILANKDVV